MPRSHDRDVSDGDDSGSVACAEPRPPSPTCIKGIAPPRRSARSLDAFTHTQQAAWQPQPQQQRDLSHISQINTNNDFDLFSARHAYGRDDKRKNALASIGPYPDKGVHKENMKLQDDHVQEHVRGSRKEAPAAHVEGNNTGQLRGSDDEACTGERLPLQQGRNNNNNNDKTNSVSSVRDRQNDSVPLCVVRACESSIVEVSCSRTSVRLCLFSFTNLHPSAQCVIAP